MTLSIANALSPILRLTKSVDVVIITPDVDDSVESSGGGEHSTFGHVIPIQSALRRTVPWHRAVVAGTLHVVAEHGSLVRACSKIRRPARHRGR